MNTHPGNRLRKARERRGLTQRAAAAAVGCTQPAISHIESSWEGSPRTRAKYAALLDVRLSTAEVVAEPSQ